MQIKSTPIPLFQVDAFTQEPFGGNPAAVCVLAQPRDDAWYQAVAAEMNLSETAFLVPHEDPFKRAYRLRWFTPKIEVDLCGHATLASAHVLWTEGYLRPGDIARFHTASGVLTAARATSGLIELDFPARTVEEVDPPAGLLDAMQISDAVFVGRRQRDYMIELPSAADVRAAAPDMSQLLKIDARAVMITAQSDDETYDMISRFFAPAGGVPEDPVTGSAHCLLAPYWHAKLGRSKMVALQASERRGVLHVEHVGDRVKLGGHAITVMKGNLV